MENNNQIKQSFELEARQITERIPMDNTQADIQQAIEKLNDFIHQRKLTLTEVSYKIGVSSAQLSQFKNGKYKGDLTSLINKVYNYINTVVKREQRAQKGFVDTSVAKTIYAFIAQVATMSETDGRIGLIVGDAGHGKSMCLRAYATSNLNSYYVMLDAMMTTKRMIGAIAEAVGVDSSGSRDAIVERLIKKLKNREVVIMLDEGSSLDVSKLDQLRQVIADKCGCGLIIAGNHHLLTTVKDDSCRRGYESLDQFNSRLLGTIDLDLLANVDPDDGGIYSEEDIVRLFTYGGIKLSKDAVEILREICQNHKSGRLRTCATIISALHLLPMVKESGKINAELIVAAIEELKLPVAEHLPKSMFAKAVKEKTEPSVKAKVG